MPPNLGDSTQEEVVHNDGVRVIDLDDNEVCKKFLKEVPAFPSGFVKLEPFNQVLPKVVLKDLQTIKEFEAKKDDVWVCSLPKCGTTWTQEMVWCIMNDLDFGKAKSTKLDERVKFFELSSITELKSLKVYGSTIDWVRNQTETPRIIKTHLSWQMLPDQVKSNKDVKIIYVTRNPRDAFVSNFNHMQILKGYKGSFEDCADAITNDVMGYAPFIHHVLEYWKVAAERDNVCFITYEEMKKDLPSVLRKVSSFLGKPIEKQEQMDALCSHLSFDKMRDNKAVNKQDYVESCLRGTNTKYEDARFMRKGQVGNWRSKFTPELERQFEAWETKWLSGSDFSFTYDI